MPRTPPRSRKTFSPPWRALFYEEYDGEKNESRGRCLCSNFCSGMAIAHAVGNGVESNSTATHRSSKNGDGEIRCCCRGYRCGSSRGDAVAPKSRSQDVDEEDRECGIHSSTPESDR